MISTGEVARLPDGALVTAVDPQGLGAEIGLQPGDRLVAINGQPVMDLLDYRFRMADEEISVLISKQDGSLVEFFIEKDYHTDLGVTFQETIFGGLRRCANQCLFCFVDQLPDGLRPSLYVKDDDYRLSFLHGSFITLTSLQEQEMQRIITQHLSPLYVSVHSTNPEVRPRLLGNPTAGRVMEQLTDLVEGGITLHCQIVLCPGVNDGPELDRTLEDLAGLFPGV
jgi:putative radical SAM enzyme (TIGR03279 family)